MTTPQKGQVVHDLPEGPLLPEKRRHPPEARPTLASVLLLTVPQSASLLQLGLNRVYEMCRTGELPSVKVGKQIRIPRAELERWVNQQK